MAGRNGRTRTFNKWFWRPLLCPLSYVPTIDTPPKGEGGGWTRTSNLGGPLALPLSSSAVQRRMSKRVAVETRRRVPVTVCGPRIQHDRHQAVFLRPLFSRFHYTILFRLFHSQDISQIKVIHNLSTKHLANKNKSCLNRHGPQSEVTVGQFLQGVFAVFEAERCAGIDHFRSPFPAFRAVDVVDL